MMLLIKPHMSNRITIGGLSSNPEEPIKVYLDQAREVDPSPPNASKARVCGVYQKEKHDPGYKNLTLLGKSKHVVINVIIIYL